MILLHRELNISSSEVKCSAKKDDDEWCSTVPVIHVFSCPRANETSENTTCYEGTKLHHFFLCC